MSEWRRITDKDDISLSAPPDDVATIDVLIDHHDGFGNVYIEIPVVFIEELLKGK